jgi:leucyl-tRNA synthetase
VSELEYNAAKVEEKWQARWTEKKVFERDRDQKQEKFFGNFPFPYVNGAMHVGHGYSALKLEAVIRYQTMLGKNALWPFAFHATGEPIVGMAKRVKEGDKNQINSLMLSGISKDKIKNFEDPYNIIRYFVETTKKTFQSLGLAIDWRREFTTTQLYPVFSKFIEWQYRKLMKMGYVVQGAHPVIYCPSCDSPTGDHDRLEGEGARIVEFTLYKFYSKEFDAYFIPGTLRPETIFGVTNVFVHPEAKYVKAKVGEIYVVCSESTLIKFKDQEFEVTEVEEIDPKKIIGTKVENPITGHQIYLLPGEFIDPIGATGVVMSVPAHAPVDWVALKHIQKNTKISKDFGIDEAILKSIKPISVIQIEGFGEFPAGEFVESKDIYDQKDPNLKDVSKEFYRKEYNHGILKAITGEYEGKSISEVKESLALNMREQQYAFNLKEPAEIVICRCGTRNHVKYIKDQWFLKFSDKKWKDKVHKLVDKMNIYPEEARNAFHYTVDWLEDKACTRQSGLGTPAPWDNTWIIETLSDSVIYMVFYMVSKYVNSGEFKEEWAVDEIFDYIILGKGIAKSLSEKFSIPIKLLTTIRKDVDYWYGFDMRSSGKDLVNNHLTYMMFHHVAIFPAKYHPKGVHVNGYVNIVKTNAASQIVEEKMSKSRGNFKTIDDVVKAYGSDSTRLGFLVAGEGMNDASFSIAEADSYRKWITILYQMALDDIDDNEYKQIDYWLISKMQEKVAETMKYMDNVQTRSAFQSAYHESVQLIKWYLNRRNSKGPAYKEAVGLILKMVVPFIPHVCEEIWEKLGNKGFISQTEFPKIDPEKKHQEAEYAEKFLGEFISDVRELIKFLVEDKNNEYPSTIEVYISPDWKYKVYMEAFRDMKNLMKNVMTDSEMKKNGKEVSNYAKTLMKMGGPPDMPWSKEVEMKTLNDSKEFLERMFNTIFVINLAEKSDHPKAKVAIPRRPGINFAT